MSQNSSGGLVINASILNAAVNLPNNPPVVSNVGEVSESLLAARERQKSLIDALEYKKLVRSISLSTNDQTIKIKLRELGHPIALFGERAPNRRERLIGVISRSLIDKGEQLNSLNLNQAISQLFTQSNNQIAQPEAEVKAYLTVGPDSLKEARLRIAQSSLVLSKKRLERLKSRSDDKAEHRSCTDRLMTDYTCVNSTISDSRPVSSISINENQTMIAASSWSGICTVSSINHSSDGSIECSPVALLKGHQFNSTHITWRPSDNQSSNQSNESSTVQLASSGMDGDILLWSLSSNQTINQSIDQSTGTPVLNPLFTLSHHTDRVNRLSFDRSGSFLYSTSSDGHVGLSDVLTGQLIVAQPGHRYGVYALALHPDNSLIATGDLGGVGLVFDTRTGRSVHALTGHAKAILGASWHDDGYVVATASEDCTVKMWDMRTRTCLYTLPAHSKPITAVKFVCDSHALVTASHDASLKIWDGRTMQQINELRGHERMIMNLDVALNQSNPLLPPLIATASYDRTFKLWRSSCTEPIDDEMKG